MRVHQLKCWPEFFEPLRAGTTTFEARRNDRDFRVGDMLVEQEWVPHDSLNSGLGDYTGRALKLTVTYILHGIKDNNVTGIREGFCVMAVNLTDDSKPIPAAT